MAVGALHELKPPPGWPIALWPGIHAYLMQLVTDVTAVEADWSEGKIEVKARISRQGRPEEVVVVMTDLGFRRPRRHHAN